MIDADELLRILACPACHGNLELVSRENASAGFACENCELVYPIRDNIPVMLVEEAVPLAEWQKKSS